MAGQPERGPQRSVDAEGGGDLRTRSAGLLGVEDVSIRPLIGASSKPGEHVEPSQVRAGSILVTDAAVNRTVGRLVGRQAR